MKTSLNSIFKCVAAGTIGYVLIGGQLIQLLYPSPEKYAEQQGLKYSPETIAFLRQHKNVRIVENGSFSKNIYYLLDPLGLYNEIKSPSKSYEESFKTTGLQNMLGIPPIVAVHPLNNHASVEAKEVYNKHFTAKITDDLSFSYTLFHELGHNQYWRKEQNENKKNSYRKLTTVEEENYADAVSRQYMLIEYPKTGLQYMAASRAVNFMDIEHDTLINLVSETSDISIDRSTSFKEFEAYAGLCFRYLNGPIDVNAPSENLGSKIIDNTYYCLHNGYEFEFDKKEDSNELLQRKESFIKGYEFLFGPPPIDFLLKMERPSSSGFKLWRERKQKPSLTSPKIKFGAHTSPDLN